MKLDTDKFWAADEEAHKDNCFNTEATQVALGIRMSEECVFAELDESGDPWGTHPRERRMDLNKRYNDKAERIVGKRLLNEHIPTADETFPSLKQIGEVFGGTYAYIPNTGIWLSSPIASTKDLENTLDNVDKMDLRSFIYPENWEAEKKRIYETYGHKPRLNRSVRGPVTLATSLYGEEDFIFLYYDAPELFKRFSDTIARVVIEMADLSSEEAGYSRDEAPHGFAFNDDNCSLMSPELYEIFGYPVLKKVFDQFSPNPGDKRHQHSDSPMAQLLPQLAKLNLTGANFGPSLTVDEIRQHMPNTRIDGQLAPFTFMRNNTDEIIAEIRRDCDMARSSRGLNIYTAGSINNGSSLKSMYSVMWAIQEYGQYIHKR